jgi:dihydroorotase
MDLLVKGAHVFDWSGDFTGDVYIRDGIIEAIGSNLRADCAAVKGEGLVLLPSFIDLHSHFRDPGLTHKEDIASGSRAAARGGYTAVNLMANTKPVCSTMDIVDYVRAKALEAGLVDVHQCVSITRDMEGEDVSHLDSLGDCVRLISDDGRGVSSDAVMLKAMEKAKSMGITVMSHAENKDTAHIDTRLSENLMTFRDIALSAYTGCRLHMAHVSTIEAMEAVIEGRKRGVPVTCEVTPHHITLWGEGYSVNPPVRGREDAEFLIESIKDGWVDAIATDHAPHTEEDKRNGVPGISGIETAFSICYTKLVKEGHITLNRLSELMSRNPAAIMGLSRGEIKPGLDGDLVLVDVDSSYKINAQSFESRGKNTPFDGMEVWGRVVMTVKGGRITYRNEMTNLGGVI